MRFGTSIQRNAMAWLFATALLALADDARAQSQKIYLELSGDKGAISALSGNLGIHASETEILAFASNVYVEDLPAMLLSKRPVRLEKAQDASSPRLLEALTTFEDITTCVIRFYFSGGPSDQLSFQIDFTNPVLVGLTGSATTGNQPSEVVSIAYDAISFTHIPVTP